MAISGVNGSDGIYPQGGSSSNRTEVTGHNQKASIWIKSDASSGSVTEQKMSRKVAKAWVKQYQEDNNCSKKEAKAAFKEQFGYNVPASFFKKVLNFLKGPLVRNKEIPESPKEITVKIDNNSAKEEIYPVEENKTIQGFRVKSGDDPFEKGRPKIIPSPIKGVTKKDTGYTIEKDKDGNTICRVDYNNNNTEAAPFDEEEVRTPEGKLKSFTERSYSGDGERNYYKKYEYDKNEKLVKITMTTCDASGKVLKSENLKIEDEPDVKLHVSLGRAIDGEGGDTELQKILADNGFTEIGNH